jgi:hypothetical protein
MNGITRVKEGRIGDSCKSGVLRFYGDYLKWSTSKAINHPRQLHSAKELTLGKKSVKLYGYNLTQHCNSPLIA